MSLPGERTYPCCPHCADDPIHDVPRDGHDLPCDLCPRTRPLVPPPGSDTWPRVVTLDAPVELAVSGPGIVTYDGQMMIWRPR